ncbi:DUF1990 family protein [uncultured Jatrophihabitans sp.]|uniref:DUF1990 family protein n=1 Tax=uncultured Jatrophihabitans sp. TaxID=1610747 RepID=UPI0035CB17BD
MTSSRTVHELDLATATRLQSEPLTYPEVGRVLTDPPPGYRHITQTRRVRSSAGFDELADAVLTWQVQFRSGLRVATSSRRAALHTVVRMGLGPIHIPCRVVAVFDEPRRRGFAYGTLPGHPERGEEAFVVEQRADGTVDFTITAFSRPATRLARLGGPVSTGVQTLMTRRYLRALDD